MGRVEEGEGEEGAGCVDGNTRRCASYLHTFCDILAWWGKEFSGVKTNGVCCLMFGVWA